MRATEARNALDRTIAPDGTDLLGEYSPPSVRRYHQNAQPKALNWVVRNNPETGSIEVLMLRRGYGSEKGLNTPPGGIQDARMTGRETAVEEALEEAGLYTNPVFELTTPIGYNQTSVVSVVDFGAPVKVQRSEVQGYSWMPLDEVTPSNVAYPEYAMPQIRQLQQWARTQTPDQFAAAATANGNSPRPRPDFSSDKLPDDGFGTVDVGDYGEELAEYGYRETADGLLVPVPVGQPIGALQGYPTELQRSHADADSQKNTESLFDDNGDGPGASLRPLDRDSAPSRTILAGGEHGGLKGTPYAPPTTPGETPYAPPTTPGETLYAPPTTPGETPYAPPTTPGETPYAPPTTPGETPYAPPTTPGDTPYAPPTTPGETPYAPPTTPGDTPYAPPTTPGDTPYAPPTTPGETPYAPPTTPGETPYAPPTTPGETPYAPPTTPGETPYAPPTTPGETPYAPPTTPGETPYAPPTTPGETPYAPPTTPGETPYAPPTTPGETPYAPPTTPGETPYAPPTTPGETPYAPPTTPGETPYAPPTTPGETPYAPPTTPGETPYAPPTTPGETPYAPPTTPGETPTRHRPRLARPPTLHRPRLARPPTRHRPRPGIRPTLRDSYHNMSAPPWTFLVHAIPLAGQIAAIPTVRMTT